MCYHATRLIILQTDAILLLFFCVIALKGTKVDVPSIAAGNVNDSAKVKLITEFKVEVPVS